MGRPLRRDENKEERNPNGENERTEMRSARRGETSAEGGTFHAVLTKRSRFYYLIIIPHRYIHHAYTDAPALRSPHRVISA